MVVYHRRFLPNFTLTPSREPLYLSKVLTYLLRDQCTHSSPLPLIFASRYYDRHRLHHGLLLAPPRTWFRLVSHNPRESCCQSPLPTRFLQHGGHRIQPARVLPDLEKLEVLPLVRHQLPGLQINQWGFNIELNWLPSLNQFNQLWAHWLGNSINIEVVVELNWLINIETFNIL